MGNVSFTRSPGTRVSSLLVELLRPMEDLGALPEAYGLAYYVVLDVKSNGNGFDSGKVSLRRDTFRRMLSDAPFCE